MLLIVTNKQDYTADFLILELQRQGIDFVRLNTEDFPSKISVSLTIDDEFLQHSHFTVYGRQVRLDEVTSVWYRRPLLPTPPDDIEDAISREFIVTESLHTLKSIWRLLQCKWVSHPDKLNIAESKPYQLRMAQRLGFRTPHSVLTTEETSAQSFIQTYEGQTIYKPLRFGQVIREDEDKTGLIYTNKVTEHHLQRLASVKYAPSLFQNSVPKKLEVRVTVVENQVFSVGLHSQELEEACIDWRRAKTTDLPHSIMQLPSEIEDRCIQLVKALELNFGAIDLICTPDDEFVFLEINPNGQWAWIEQTLPEVRIRQALIKTLTMS